MGVAEHIFDVDILCSIRSTNLIYYTMNPYHDIESRYGCGMSRAKFNCLDITMPYILDDLELGILVRILNQHSAQTSADPCLSALLGNLEHAWRRSQMPFASTSELFGHLDDNAANLDAEQASFPVARHHGVYSDVDDHLSDSDNPDAGFQVCHPSSLVSTLYIF
jgi:hypothetical protein